MTQTLSGFEFIPLAPDEGDDSNYNSVDDEDNINWIDDSECQENLFQIVPLMPEESCIDENNHIQGHVKLFFPELGYLTEEPEPIDPTRDYEEEARILLQERNQTRQKHVDFSRMPSLAHSRSGVSSTSSSIHHVDYPHDVRSPLYMGHPCTPVDHHHLLHPFSHHPPAPHHLHHHHPHHYHPTSTPYSTSHEKHHPHHQFHHTQPLTPSCVDSHQYHTPHHHSRSRPHA